MNSMTTKVLNRVRDVRLLLKPPRGTDLFRDLRKYSGVDFRTVFDVGAHKGESALAYLRHFPDATVYSFEPVRNTFDILGSMIGDHHRSKRFNLAFSDEKGEGEIAIEAMSDRSHLKAPGEVATNVQRIEIQKLDDFCEAMDIPEIDFLKIDTEGADLNVLKGAERMISSGAIRMIQVESGMNRGNKTHVPFQDFADHLEDRGYSVFGLYEQHGEKKHDFAIVRRVNAVFLYQPDGP